MSKIIPPCQFGFLALTGEFGQTIYVKVNKITAIENVSDEEDMDFKSYIYLDLENVFSVKENIDEILKHMEGIHPTLR